MIKFQIEADSCEAIRNPPKADINIKVSLGACNIMTKPEEDTQNIDCYFNPYIYQSDQTGLNYR